MPFYDEKYYMDTLRFDDIFTSSEQFIAKVVEVGGITDSLKLAELYQVLSFKYISSFTRYTTEFPFIMAIKRELHTEFPFYFKKKELADQMMEMEIAEIQQQTRQLRNLVDTHDEPIVNASTTPINDLSTQQEYIGVKTNELEAVKQKYAVMNKNYLQGIYARCDELFRVMLTEDIIPVYEV
jgi:hypothetical protein